MVSCLLDFCMILDSLRWFLCIWVSSLLFQALWVCFCRDSFLPVPSVWVSGCVSSAGNILRQVEFCHQGQFLGEAPDWTLRSGLGVPLSENGWIRMLVCFLTKWDCTNCLGSLVRLTRLAGLHTKQQVELWISFSALLGQENGPTRLIVSGPKSGKAVYWIPWLEWVNLFCSTDEEHRGQWSLFKCHISRFVGWDT